MSLLKLSNIGKIYVSGETVAVGIRGVNLEFDIGEFVAITGKSGSGKTTLLNVISGMDTYEEGELYIEGEATSHYDQSDWEEYRQKYISFIFQDYNIIESFTVLQNVELALSNSYAPRERRKRALELIERVGLTKFKNHKGSKLSGGQKQRTVIARALAKDSPIILADEPTGNLDSQTSKEIIALLAEISKEKLVIVVTHNFDEVAECATREVRVFDGSIERDEARREATRLEYTPKTDERKRKGDTLRKGMELGAFRFVAMPKLSIFTCIIMIIAMLGSFFATSILFQGSDLFEKNYIMTHMDGRVAVSPQDGSAVSEEKIKTLADKVGAESYVVYDAIFENQYSYGEFKNDRYYSTLFTFMVDDSMRPSVGRRPEKKNEAMVYIPIEMQPVFGKKEVLVPTLDIYGDGSALFDIVGIKYFYDNNKAFDAKIILTSEGFSELSKKVPEGYSQSSLFFKNDRIAEQKIAEIRGNGFNAVASSFTYSNPTARLLEMILISGQLLLWLGVMVFIAFFLSVCTSRIIISKLGDVAILRSMGIKVKVIKISMYTQMALASIPAVIALLISASVIYLTPSLNPMMPYLYFYEYALIIIGVLIIGFRITRRNNKKMFSGSVRKTLRRDAADEA